MKELPHDLLAEKSLIGCLIIDSGSYDQLSDLRLKKDHFYNPQYGIIFEAVKDLADSNRPIDFVTVCSKLTERGQLESIGGQTAVAGIIEDQASAANIVHYGKVVKEKASMREIIRHSMRVTDKGLSYTGNVSDFFKEVESTFFMLTNEAKASAMQTLSSCLRQNLKELEDTGRRRGDMTGLPTGYTVLDKYLLGLQAGQLVILAARPAMGKTSLALNIAVNAASVSGLPVAIFSLEMMASELTMRLLSGKAKVDSKRLKTKEFLDTDLRNIGTAIKQLSSLQIQINDSGGTSVIDIQSACRKIRSEYGLGLIVIDYLQLLKPANDRAPREQQIAEMSRSLKEIAKELQCPIIVLSQLNRSVETRVDKRPQLGDLRESGSIEQDADIVMFVYRDDYYNKDSKEPGIAEIIVSKNRSGEQGTAKLAWVGAYTSFENLAWEK